MDDGRLVGIVDVLKLTYATLEQIETMNDDRTTDGGPMWGKFFETLGSANQDDDVASVTSHSERPDTPSRPSFHNRGLSSITSPVSEVMPNDSASAADNDSDQGKQALTSSLAPSAPVDDGTYIFKFRTPSGRTHRFQARHDSFELLRDIIHGKLINDPFFAPPALVDGQTMHLPDPAAFTVSYTDDEGDLVTMTADTDVSDAVRIARGQKSDRVVLLIDGGKLWEDAARDIGGEKAVESLQHIEHETKGVDDEDEHLADVTKDPATEPTYGHSVHRKPDTVGGVLPKEYLLPAAIGFLGVVIVGVFVATRATKN